MPPGLPGRLYGYSTGVLQPPIGQIGQKLLMRAHLPGRRRRTLCIHDPFALPLARSPPARSTDPTRAIGDRSGEACHARNVCLAGRRPGRAVPHASGYQGDVCETHLAPPRVGGGRGRRLRDRTGLPLMPKLNHWSRRMIGGIPLLVAAWLARSAAAGGQRARVGSPPHDPPPPTPPNDPRVAPPEDRPKPTTPALPAAAIARPAWYRRPLAIVASLILCFPIGLVLMWRSAPWPRWAKIGVSIIVLGLALDVSAAVLERVARSPVPPPVARIEAKVPPAPPRLPVAPPPNPPTVVPTAAPPSATAAPAPTAPSTRAPAPSPSPAPPIVVVVDTGSSGLLIRRTPGGEPIKVWPEGTQLVDLGEEREAQGRSWKSVRDPDGNQGWGAADFLAAPPGEIGAARAVLTPSPSPASRER